MIRTSGAGRRLVRTFSRLTGIREVDEALFFRALDHVQNETPVFVEALEDCDTNGGLAETIVEQAAAVYRLLKHSSDS